jgi:hypothetical protein
MMPGLAPARTRLARAMESLARSEDALAVAVSLGTQTTEAGRLEQLDGALRSNRFFEWLESASVTPRILDEDSALANGLRMRLTPSRSSSASSWTMAARAGGTGSCCSPLSQCSVRADPGCSRTPALGKVCPFSGTPGPWPTGISGWDRQVAGD